MLRLENQSQGAAHWPEPVYNAIFDQSPSRIALLAEESGSAHQLLGFIVARLSADECELENIVVASSAGRKGIATELMSSLIAAAQDRRVYKIFLEVRESNQPARRLYEKSGFTLTGTRKSYYANPTEDALLYLLDATLRP
jgi:ribosomal-protein-alanine N-acetyltransferase